MAEKAVLEVEGSSEDDWIEVMFNPESYQLSQTASYSEKRYRDLTVRSVSLSQGRA